MSTTNTSIEFEFPALKEAQANVDAKQKALHEVFDQAGADVDLSKVTAIAGSTSEKAAAIKGMNDELTALGVKRDELLEVAKAAKAAAGYDPERPGSSELGDDRPSERGEGKGLGELFVGSKAYSGRVSGGDSPAEELDMDVKTLMSTSAGWAPQSTRTGMVVDFATRPIQVIDIIPKNTTGQAAVVYMEETTFTNNAAETAEGGTFGEAALVLTQRTKTVAKITVWLPITDEQLEDEPQAQGYVNNRLPFMLRQRLDGQLLVGDGAGANLTGFLNVAGVQTQAKGADPVPDAVYKACTKVRTTGQALPNAYITNPTDWQDVRLLRTADGIYIWGNPADAGPERIWGLQVVQAQAETVDTGLVGDFANFSEYNERRGIEVKISNSHSTFFVEGKQAVRADMRGVLVVYRPTAFCTVTGI